VAKYGLDHGAEFLLAHGAVVDARDNAGQTPLHYASARGDDSLAKLLLAKGADVNARDTHGKTPLYVTLQVTSSYLRDDVEKVLRQHGGHE
jgi:ankyrin repeat protein